MEKDVIMSALVRMVELVIQLLENVIAHQEYKEKVAKMVVPLVNMEKIAINRVHNCVPAGIATRFSDTANVIRDYLDRNATLSVQKTPLVRTVAASANVSKITLQNVIQRMENVSANLDFWEQNVNVLVPKISGDTDVVESATVHSTRHAILVLEPA